MARGAANVDHKTSGRRRRTMTLHWTGRHDGFSRHHVPCSRPASERSRSRRSRGRMDKLADALVYAISYINCRDEDGDETYLHDDVKSLEWLAHILHQATPTEEDALAA